jgi:hypothetical protein
VYRNWLKFTIKVSFWRELLNWRQLEQGTPDGWQPVTPSAAPAQSPHMTALANLMNGEQHTLADFALGLRVQETIEEILHIGEIPF